jgi:H+-transporting ATPase
MAARKSVTTQVDLTRMQKSKGHHDNDKGGQIQNRARDGLTSGDIQQLREKYGYNELPEREKNPIIVFLSYFWGPIPWMIEIAVILSAVVKDWTDFAIILILLFMNAAVGFWEEHQAGNAIKALKSHLAVQARVKRDGTWTRLPARELIPNDLIRVRIGDIVPADSQLIDDNVMQVDQSALTGESLPVEKKSSDVIYSGSVIKQGESDAIVTATGEKTYFGKTARLVESAHSVSHFQKAILRIGNFLIVIALALVTLILIVGIIRGEHLLTTLQFALILTVAAIPAAMPAVLSVTMAVGARKLAKKDAIVRRLASIEELAGVNVLCSDKTGTITKNQLSISEPFCTKETTAEEIIVFATLASREEDQDSIDLAIIKAIRNRSLLEDYKVITFTPFDPVHKRTEAEIQDKSGTRFKVSKGAPQVILSMSSNERQVGGEAEKAISDFASRGYRSLGVARTDEDGNWRFLGIIPLYDPPREDSRETIDHAKNLGIRVKMVTGDQLAIAREIARQVGLGTDIRDAGVFDESRNEAGTDLRKIICQSDGFSQVYPEHKFEIVDALQKAGQIVAMTGDGVNDAPALKKADAGIAVSGATDAARAAASIVLLSPGLSVIIDAFRISRKIFHRMTSYALYRIAETIRVLLFMTISILLYHFYPVTAAMIVLLALLNDGPILTMAYDRALPSPRPVKWKMKELLGISSMIGIFGVIASFLLLIIGKSVAHLSAGMIQTLVFLKLAVAGHLTIFITRTRGPFWSFAPSPALLWSAVGTKMLATMAAVYGVFMPAIGWKWAVLVWVYAGFWMVINDYVKRVGYAIIDRIKYPVHVTSGNNK